MTDQQTIIDEVKELDFAIDVRERQIVDLQAELDELNRLRQRKAHSLE